MKILLALVPLLAAPSCLQVRTALPVLLDVVNPGITNLCASGVTSCPVGELCTNRNVWTWPAQLSFIGVDVPAGFSHPLIAPNFIVANAHYGAQSWTSAELFRYHDTNGVQHDIPFTGMHFILGDLVLCQLASNATGVVLPSILPPDYTNYFAGHNPSGLDLFWFHHNAAAVEHCQLNSFFPSGSGATLETVTGHYSPTFAKGGSGPTVGDSGSPVMTFINGQVVLLFCQTDGGGCGVGDLIFYTNIVNYCPPKLVDLAGYERF